MCSRSDSEHTWADLRHIRNIFKGHFRSTLEICENSVFSDYELLGDRLGPRKYCNKFFVISYNFIKLWNPLYCDWLFWGVLPQEIFRNFSVFTTILIIFRR